MPTALSQARGRSSPRGGKNAGVLDASVLEKALYELRYELNSRPDWVNVPLQGILDLVEAAQGGAAGQP